MIATIVMVLVVFAVAFGLRSPTPWTGIGFVVTWVVFMLAGSAWLPRSLEPPEQGTSWVEPLRYVVVASAVGLSTAVVLWSLSLLFAKSLTPATIVLLGLAIIGGWRRARARASLAPTIAAVPICLTGIALALGLYIFGLNELRDGSDLVFTYRWDLATHMYWASLIRELGLPIVEHNGARDVPYMPLYHTGVLVAAAGVEQLTASSLYQAARILGVGCLILIALTSGALAARFALHGWQTVLSGIAPLIWAGLSLPADLLRRNWSGVLDPYAGSVVPFSAAAGSFYHSLPQVSAVALGATALVLLERYETMRQSRDLVLCGVLLGVSTLLKPTVVMLFVPAIVIVLGLARVHLLTLLSFVAAVAAGAFVFAVPALLADLPTAPRWGVYPGRLLRLKTAVEIAAVGLVVPIGIARGAQLFRRGVRTGWQALDVVLVAVGGGVLFAAVFAEPGERAAALNQFWPRNAAVLLAAPYLTAVALRFTQNALFELQPPAWHRFAGVVTIAMLAQHLATGAIYATRYPWLSINRVSAEGVATLRAITSATPDTARLLADVTHTVAPYLPRRIVFGGSQTEALYRDLDEWRQLRNGSWNDTLRAFVAARDGIVLGPRTRHLEARLATMGWTRQMRGATYEYWAPRQRASSDQRSVPPLFAMPPDVRPVRSR